ncbi:MAG: ABC transporter permease [Chloroflexi bacterium]|nr:ABC transporter permease [Chloroflexota bacterium]
MADLNLQAVQPPVSRGRLTARRMWRDLRRSPSAIIGLIIVAFLVFVAVSADALAPYDPLEVNPMAAMMPPGPDHWIGTDALGRDQLSRIMHGTRLSLQLGLIATSIAAVVGSVVGLAAGYYRGALENVIMSLNDVLLAFPYILLALAIVYALGINMTNLMIAVGIGGIPGYVRVVRGTVLTIKENTYIEASRVIGCTDFRIMLKHILPNAVAPIIVLATMGVASAILTGSSLSFLGLGTKPPTPEWGVMLSEGRSFMAVAWWVATFPGIAISLAVLGMNLLGNGLRDILDPRLRRD